MSSDVWWKIAIFEELVAVFSYITLQKRVLDAGSLIPSSHI